MTWCQQKVKRYRRLVKKGWVSYTQKIKSYTRIVWVSNERRTKK